MGKLSKTRKSIKGFTLTELAIVIAVIAILVAVLVPTFIALIDKANKSSDSQLVSYINDALVTEGSGSETEQVEVEIDGNTTSVYNVVDAISSLEDYGYGISNLTAKADGADMVYNATTNRFIYYTEDFTEITYGTAPADTDVLVVITDSSLSRQAAVESSSSIIRNRGVNYCVYSEDSVVNLANDNSVTVWLYTVENSTVTINVPSGTVYQYGAIKNLTVTAVAGESLHVYGKVNALTMVSGHLKYEESGEVKYLYVASDNASNVKLTLNENAVVLSDGSSKIDDYETVNIGSVTDTTITYDEVADYKAIFEEYEVTEEPTCTKEGKMTYTSIFGTKVYQTLDMIDHTSEGEITISDVTAIVSGNEIIAQWTESAYKCSVCGESLDSATKTEALSAVDSSILSTLTGKTFEINGWKFTIASDYATSKTITLDSYSGSGTAVIPTNVTIIGDSAFLNNTSVTSITIPESVTSIGKAAFSGCTNLTALNYNAANAVVNQDLLDYLEEDENERSGYTASNYIFYNAGTSGNGITVRIGAEVKAIPDDLFYSYSGSPKITSVIFNCSECTSIGDYAFYNLPISGSITIPSNVTSIGKYAFYGCSDITGTLTIPSNVTSIGSAAFRGCSGITGTLIIPSNVATLESSAFYGCSGIEKVIINTTKITKINSSTFYGCTGLTSIGDNSNDYSLNIPSNITTIDSSAFYGCSGLTTVVVPSTVTEIKGQAFGDCINLESITLPFAGTSASATYASTLFGQIFTIGNSSSSTRNGYTLVEQEYVQSNVTKYVYKYLPNSLKTVTITSDSEIPYGAFSGCTMIETINLPSSITSIGEKAFYNCSALTGIVVPDSVTSIGSAAFSGCSSLASITLPFVGEKASATGANSLFGYIFGTTSYTGATSASQYYSSSSSVTYYIPTSLTTVTVKGGSISYGAFQACQKLTSITLSGDIESIGDKAFNGCWNLENIVIPETVTQIGSYAFGDCESLTSIVIPDSVQSIGNAAFYGCSALEEITLPFVGSSASATTASQSTLFGYIFWYPNDDEGVDGFKEITQQTTYSSDSQVKFSLPESLTTVTITGGKILAGAFSGCTMLTNVTLENITGNISSYAFYNCSNLESVAITNSTSVTEIGSSAFKGCTKLTTINIPDTVTEISDAAFNECSSLASIVLPSKLTKISSTAFQKAGLTSITIPDSVTSVGTTAFQYCTSLESAVVGTGLTEIPNYMFEYCSALTSVTLKGNVTSIGSSAFNGTAITSIDIPETVTIIGTYAFHNCTSLKTLTLLGDVTSLGTGAFEGCSSLISLTLGDNVTNISQFAMSKLTSLTAISVTDNNSTYMAKDNNLYTKDGSMLVLYALGKITEQNSTITISGVETIGSYVFYTCTTLTGVTIGDDVITISDNAFQGCTALASITFEANSKLETIGSYAFNSCSSLTSITLPASLETIEQSAFNGCTKLASVTFEANSKLATIGSYAFYNCQALESIIIPASVTKICVGAFQSTGLTSATFEDTESSWTCTYNSSTNATIAASTLSDKTTAANYLHNLKVNSGYSEHEWVKNS